LTMDLLGEAYATDVDVLHAVDGRVVAVAARRLSAPRRVTCPTNVEV
jgi:hypothetical protein